MPDMPAFPLRLVIPLLIVAFALAVGLYNFHTQSRTAGRETEQRALVALQHRLEQLEHGIERFVLMRDRGLVQSAVGALSRVPQIVFALVTDARGRIIGSLRRQYLGQRLRQVLPDLTPVAREAVSPLLDGHSALRARESCWEAAVMWWEYDLSPCRAARRAH